ncbi:unnamed protein product [Closterium sp. NIES-54]
MSVIALLPLLPSARRTCSRFPPIPALLLLPLLALLLAALPHSLCAAERANRLKPAATRLVLLPNNAYGAKCLDGSPPAYYFRAGAGAGRRKWHVHLPTGGWCFSPRECLNRTNSPLGSSRFWARHLPAVIENGGKVPNVSADSLFLSPLPLSYSRPLALFSRGRRSPSATPLTPLCFRFPLYSCNALHTAPHHTLPQKAMFEATIAYPQLGGLLSRSRRANPVFHEWNLVWVVYCDGGAYSSTRGRADLGGGASVYMNGRGILDALIYGSLGEGGWWEGGGGGGYLGEGASVYMQGQGIMDALIHGRLGEGGWGREKDVLGGTGTGRMEYAEGGLGGWENLPLGIWGGKRD